MQTISAQRKRGAAGAYLHLTAPLIPIKFCCCSHENDLCIYDFCNPGMSDTQLRQLITAHIDEDEFCRYVIQRDINGIALALRETHKDDFFSVPEDNPLKEMLETAGEIVSQDSDTEQAYLAFICKRLKLNFRKLSVEERKWLKKIAEKSDLLKNPKPQRGRR